MRSRAILWAALLALLPGAASAVESDLSDAVLGGLSYRGILTHPVQLEGGLWAGPTAVAGSASHPRVELARNGIARGDLDGDGREDAAVLLLSSAGGTGLHHYVAVVSERDGTPRNVATAELGDRIQIVRFEVEEGRIVLEAVVAGSYDPMCCPTRKVRRTLRLDGDELEAAEEDLGSAGLADLGGHGWRLTRLDVAETPSSSAPITLELRDEQLVGSAGCNRYSSRVTSEGGQQLSLGPLGTTRRACPEEVMEDETAFLSRLQQVDRFSFVMGDLALSYELDGHVGTLFFERGDEAP